MKMAAWTAGLTLKKNRYDLAIPKTLIEHDAQSAGDYAREKLNERIYDFLIRPGIEPFWYFSCEDVSAGMVIGLTSKAAGARFYYFRNGIDELAQQLLANTQLHCNHEVLNIQYEDEHFELQHNQMAKRTFKNTTGSSSQPQPLLRTNFANIYPTPSLATRKKNFSKSKPTSQIFMLRTARPDLKKATRWLYLSCRTGSASSRCIIVSPRQRKR